LLVVAAGRKSVDILKLVSGSELPRILGGRYRPERVLGRGGMGVVYVVEHVRTGQRLALKLLALHSNPSPESIERFKREARTSSKIRSDHVVLVTDADVAPELDGAPFLVMELLEGRNLAQAVGDSSAEPKDVVDWLRQVARGLGKAHELGIVHRDLKPENLFLARRDDGSPLVKILDFGIAKMLAEGVTKTQSGQLIGTPLFMAPEQALGGDEPITLQTDLFALGLIAFRLLTGRSYWREGRLAQLVAQILFEPVAPPSTRGSTLGPAFDEWFLQACHRDPSKRFPSAREMVEALAESLGLPRLASPVEVSGVRQPQQSFETSTAASSEITPASSTDPLQRTTGASAALSAPSFVAPRPRSRTVLVVAAATVALGGAGLLTRLSHSQPPSGSAGPPKAVAAEATAAPSPSTSPGFSAAAPSSASPTRAAREVGPILPTASGADGLPATGGALPRAAPPAYKRTAVPSSSPSAYDELDRRK
jgi:eukaryotic-like serine/threonine-protein kinase